MMRYCENCRSENPNNASYCMYCGTLLPPPHEEEGQSGSGLFGGFNSLGMSLAISLAISLVLMFVFKLPIFILFGFLPLLWAGKGKNRK
jgi:hypothetical protein